MDFDDYALLCLRILDSKPNLEKPFSHIIIDEAQDVIDKGVDIVLNELLSSQHNGLKQGRYLVFYDLEQGSNSCYFTTCI